jgi:hypothetical protein
MLIAIIITYLARSGKLEPLQKRLDKNSFYQTIKSHPKMAFLSKH